MADAVDKLLNQWRTTRPDIDPSPMELTSRLLRVAAHTRELMEHTLGTVGLDRGLFDVLATLYRTTNNTGTLTAGELARWGMVSGGALTNRVDRLVRAGLVNRSHDPTNRRRVLIELTDTGRATIEKILPAHIDTCARAASGLAPNEIQQLNALLRKMAQ